MVYVCPKCGKEFSDEEVEAGGRKYCDYEPGHYCGGGLIRFGTSVTSTRRAGGYIIQEVTTIYKAGSIKEHPIVKDLESAVRSLEKKFF